ncbi:esterase/lipase family protein [Rhodococcus gordoniae]
MIRARRSVVATATAALALASSMFATPAISAADPAPAAPAEPAPTITVPDPVPLPTSADAPGSPLATLLSTMGEGVEGANDLGCVPSPDHPRPVVLVHGTGTGMYPTWVYVAPELARLGYCVYALNYGAAQGYFDPERTVWGVSDIERSAVELGTFVDAVREHTGSEQVDLVGHSQGGVVSRQYLKFEGGTDATDPSRNRVRNLVMLGATNHGTTFNGLQQLYTVLAVLGVTNGNDAVAELLFRGSNLGAAGQQQLIGSRMLSNLNEGGDTLPGVTYTSIATRHDQIVTPPESSFLRPGPDAEVHNVWVQDGCPDSPADHSTILVRPESLHLVKSALDPGYAAAHAVPCDLPENG